MLLRRNHPRGRTPFSPGIAACDALERRALFATTVFTIDPTASRVGLTGEAVGVELRRQDDGSLSARYEGTIVTDVVMGASPTLRFLGGGNAAAEMRGRFEPGDAPANYAGEAVELRVQVAEAAVRNLQLDLVSDPITVAPNGTFPSNAARVRVLDGQFDYDARGVGEGSFELGGDTAVPNTTIATSSLLIAPDGSLRLTIPVDVTYTYSNPPAELRLRGQIVAVAGADAGLRPRVDANGPFFGNGAAAVFTATENAPPAPAVDAAGLTVFDYDSVTLAGATVVLENRRDGVDELLAVDTSSTSTSATPVTAEYDPTTGTLLLSGNATPAQYQQVLRTLTYDNNSAEIDYGMRALRITLRDEAGEGPASVGAVSVEEPLNINVPRIGTGALPGSGKSVLVADADGTQAIVTIAGGGTALVRFSGVTGQTVLNNVTSVSGTDVRFLRVDTYGTTARTKLTFRVLGGGDGQLDVPGISADGPLNAVGGKGVNLTGDLSVGGGGVNSSLDVTLNGRINRATFNRVVGAEIEAFDILKMTVAGDMTDSTLTVGSPFAPLSTALGSLAVRGAISGSRVWSNGNVGSVTAASLVNSEIYAGIADDSERFPTPDGGFAFPKPAVIGRVALRPPVVAGSASFENSVVAARHLGRLSLGLIDTDNGGTPFGVAAHTIAALAGTNAAGQRLNLTALDDPGVLAALAASLPFTFGDFRIHLE